MCQGGRACNNRDFNRVLKKLNGACLQVSRTSTLGATMTVVEEKAASLCPRGARSDSSRAPSPNPTPADVEGVGLGLSAPVAHSVAYSASSPTPWTTHGRLSHTSPYALARTTYKPSTSAIGCSAGTRTLAACAPRERWWLGAGPY